MAFAILVCALFLFTILYFTALLTTEIALWLKDRVSLAQQTVTISQTQH